MINTFPANFRCSRTLCNMKLGLITTVRLVHTLVNSHSHSHNESDIDRDSHQDSHSHSHSDSHRLRLAHTVVNSHCHSQRHSHSPSQMEEETTFKVKSLLSHHLGEK